MQPTYRMAAVVLAAILAGLPASAQDKDAGTKKTITAMEYIWAEAGKNGKPEVVAPMLAGSFITTDVDGNTYGKATLLSNIKGGKWEQNGISDVQVTVYGNTAIATGTWAGKGVDGDGTQVNRREHWTDTWVKMGNGKWLCVASQQTSVVNH